MDCVKSILGYWKTIVVSGVILYLSLIRHPHVQLPTFTGLDKLIHCAMYFILASVWTSELQNHPIQRSKNIVLALLFPIVYGGAIELLQEYFFPPRTGDWWDWAADIAGTIIGFISIKIIWKIRRSSI